MKSLLHNSRKHDITFHASGKIDISAHIARKLSLAPGDVVDIADDSGEWWLYVKYRNNDYIGRYESVVYATNKQRKGTMRVYSKALCKKVLALVGATTCLRCPCGEVVYRNNKPFISIIYRCAL